MRDGTPARALAAVLTLAAAAVLEPASAPAAAVGSASLSDGPAPEACVAPGRVELEATGRAPGASGFATLRFAPSPYGVAVTEDGSYRYRVEVHVRSVPPAVGDTLVAWAATPELDRHVKLGTIGDDGTVRGEVSWNKFLLFVTAEPSPETGRWRGPVLMTGTSPAGNMHTMAGHGIYQQHGIGC